MSLGRFAEDSRPLAKVEMFPMNRPYGSSNHPIRPREQVWGHSQTDRIRRFQVDRKLELHRLLDRQVRGFGAFEYLVDIAGGTSIVIDSIRSIAHQAASLDIISVWVNHR